MAARLRERVPGSVPCAAYQATQAKRQAWLDIGRWTPRTRTRRATTRDFEARLTVVEALAKLPPEQQKTYRELLDELPRRVAVGNTYLTQMELNLDWPAYVAKMYRAAEDLSDAKNDAKWEEPPK